MTEKAEQILESCKELLKYTKREYINELRLKNYNKYISKCNTKFESFFTRYPTLFYKIIDDPDNFNMDRLIEMLNLKKKIEKNETSHENASKNIGDSYYNEFVKPIIDDKNK